MKLYDYQRRAVEEIHFHLDNGRDPLTVAATGAGKTVISGQLIQDLTQQGKRVMFLVHRDVLVEQTSSKLDAFGVTHGFIKAGWNENREALAQIACIGTLRRRDWWRSHPFDVVIYDEAHRTAFDSISDVIKDELPNARSLGLSATPWRLGKGQMSDKFNAEVFTPLPYELMEMGFLVKPTYYRMDMPDLSEVELDFDGDYKVASLSKAMQEPIYIAKLVEEYQRLAYGKRGVAISVSVEHARAIAAAFNTAGIPSAAVDGSTPIPERNRIYSKLASGELSLLSGCAVFCEGFDVPAVEVCILARPTKSQALYFQQIGRVLRPSSGKDSSLILDQAGNVHRFGFVEDLSEFELRHGKPKNGTGEIPLKVCPPNETDIYGHKGCGELLRAFETKCQCGYCFITPKVRQQGQLVELSPQLPAIAPKPCPHQAKIDELAAIAQQRNYKPGWLGFRALEIPGLTLQDLKYAASKAGFKPGWAWHQWKALQDKQREAQTA